MITPDRSLNYAERWMRDSLAVIRPAFSALQVTVDMTESLKKLDGFRQHGVPATATHLLVRATACALAANPDLHQLIVGNRSLHPSRIDIGLSITGDHFISPILVLEGADQKTIEQLAEETARRAPEVRQADQQLWQGLQRWGWLVPFGFLRRIIMRRVISTTSFRKKAGTFQVSTVPVDWALASTFIATGVIVGGQVHSEVRVVDNQPAVRPVMKLTLSIDHGVWDGRAAVRFLAAVKTELETTP